MSYDKSQDIKRISDFIEINTKKDKNISTLDSEEFENFIQLLRNIVSRESLFESLKEAQEVIIGENNNEDQIVERYDSKKLSTIKISIENFLSVVDTYKKSGKNKKHLLVALDRLCNQVTQIIHSLEAYSKELYSDKYAISINLFPPWMFKDDVKLSLGKLKNKNLNCRLMEVPIGELNTLIWEKNKQIDIRFSKELILATINMMIYHKNFGNDIKAHFASVIHCQSVPEILSIPRSLTDYCKRGEPIDNLILSGYNIFNSLDGSEFERGFETIKTLTDSSDWQSLTNKFKKIAEDFGSKYFGDSEKLKLNIGINSKFIEKLKNPMGSLINDLSPGESELDTEEERQKAKEVKDIQSGNV